MARNAAAGDPHVAENRVHAASAASSPTAADGRRSGVTAAATASASHTSAARSE